MVVVVLTSEAEQQGGQTAGADLWPGLENGGATSSLA